MLKKSATNESWFRMPDGIPEKPFKSTNNRNALTRAPIPSTRNNCRGLLISRLLMVSVREGMVKVTESDLYGPGMTYYMHVVSLHYLQTLATFM